jgi:hypothetical protein
MDAYVVSSGRRAYATNFAASGGGLTPGVN